MLVKNDPDIGNFFFVDTHSRLHVKIFIKKVGDFPQLKNDLHEI